MKFNKYRESGKTTYEVGLCWSGRVVWAIVGIVYALLFFKLFGG